MYTASTMPRDGNNVPLQRYGVLVTKSVTFSANGTVNVALFNVTGSVLVNALYGVVTTAIGSNHTAAYWRLNDGGATPAVSLATGTTVSSLPAGSFLIRRSLVSVALTASTAATSIVTDPVAATPPDEFMPFVATQKTGGVTTQLEYVYTTNNSSAGTIKFYAYFTPLSDDGDLTAA